MFRQYLEKIDGIGLYPMISFTVFFLFFIAVGVWVMRANRQHLEAMSRLPLDPDSETAKTDAA